MNKNLGIFYVASLSILLLASTVAIPLQAFAEPVTNKVPVVILFNDKVSSDKINLIKANGGEITRNYEIINGLAANLPQQAIQNLENNPSVISVDLDIEFHAIELNADQTIGADQVWSHSTPATGNGVKVAILDTGIDANHQEFSSGRIIGCESEMGKKEPTCNDLHGHGTHVAGIVGAEGFNLAAKGVAYDVSYLIDKVLDKRGSGSLSGIIAGIDWAVANDAQVISMSLGTSAYSNQNASDCDSWYTSMTTAVNNAVAANVTVVAAAGNSGSSGVGLPACIGSTIAIAAVDDNDKIASFSSVGGAVKDHGISAPGVAIYSSLPGDNYASWSGTSMATPVVAGSIALLLEKNPNLTPEDVKNTLFDTACTSPSCSFISSTSTNNYGHGRINVLSAYNSITSLAPIVNEPPTATPDTYSIEMNTPLSVNALNGILANDSDGNGDTLTASIQTDPSHAASFTLNSDGSFDYTPSADYLGDDTFTYDVSDGNGGTDSETVTIAVESPPVTGTTIMVEDSIVYTTNGGKDGDRHLTHSISLKNDLGNYVSGAIVGITLDNITGGSWSATATTDENGRISFTLKNAPTGCYETTVNTVSSDLAWDGFTPTNQFGLRTSCP